MDPEDMDFDPEDLIPSWLWLQYWDSPLWRNIKGELVDVRKISPRYARNIQNLIKRCLAQNKEIPSAYCLEEIQDSIFWKMLDQTARGDDNQRND